MTLEKKDTKRVDPELATDPNYLAYQSALDKGEFTDLEPGTYVVFNDGKLVAVDADRKAIIEKLNGLGVGGFMTRVNLPEEVLPGFFTDPEGKLHRGVSTWANDGEGIITPVYLEWGSNNIYPRKD